MKKVLVLGSLNKDLVSFVKQGPNMGETMQGQSFTKFNGGKGANQAVAIANMGIETTMLGAVGSDEFGLQLVNGLKEKNINSDNIIIKKTNSGLAIITVDEKSNNSIIVHGGANDLLSTSDIENHKNIFSQNHIFVTQLENSPPSVLFGLKIAKQNNLTTILTPAPSSKFNKEMIAYCDFLALNEHEFEDIFNLESSKENLISISHKHPHINFLLTLGSKGVMYAKEGQINFYAANKVKAIDTTAAGDSFVGGFISQFANNKSIEDAINFGQKVAAICVTRKGAQEAMPTLQEIQGE